MDFLLDPVAMTIVDIAKGVGLFGDVQLGIIGVVELAPLVAFYLAGGASNGGDIMVIVVGNRVDVSIHIDGTASFKDYLVYAMVLQVFFDGNAVLIIGGGIG